MKRSPRLALLLPVLVVLACTSQPTPLPSRNFDRPTDVTFVCMGAYVPSVEPAPAADGGAADADDAGDDGGAAGVAAEGGAPAEADAGASGGGLVLSGRPMRECHSRGAIDPPADVQHRTFGFIPNSTSGQLTIVDADRWKLIDLDPTIAGFNQFPLGVLPTQIAASDDGCRIATANHGSCDLSLVDPAALLQPTLSLSRDEKVRIPDLPAQAPGKIGWTVQPNYGPDRKALPLAAQELAFVPEDTAKLKGGVQLCSDTWRRQAIVTFPSCSLIALVNLPGGEIVDGVYVRRVAGGKVEPEALNGRAPECPIEDCAAESPSQADAGASAGPDAGAPIDRSVRPGPIAILPDGHRVYVGLTDSPFILALEVAPDHLAVPATPSLGVIPLHDGALGTNRIRLSIDPYAEKTKDGPRFMGSFVGNRNHTDRQYLYAVARDGSVRVVHVAEGADAECETNVDPLSFPAGEREAQLQSACLTVEAHKVNRRPTAFGPGLRLGSPAIDVAVADVPPADDHSENSVAGTHAWVLTANGGIFLVNIDPVLRFTASVEANGHPLMCVAGVECQPEKAPPPNTPRNRNIMSYSRTLGALEGSPRLDVEPTAPPNGPRIESIWTRGSEDNPTQPVTGDYVRTQVFFPDPTAVSAQTWSVTWEGALMNTPRFSGKIMFDAGPNFFLDDPGMDYCRLGLRAGDLVTVYGCVDDGQCGNGRACAHGTEGTQGAGGLPINGLCVNKYDRDGGVAVAQENCAELLSTVRRYEVTTAGVSRLAITPHKDELVRPDLKRCVLRSAGATTDGGTGDGGAGADGGSDDGSQDGGAGDAPDGAGPSRRDDCFDPDDLTTEKFQCIAMPVAGTNDRENRCLMPCTEVGGRAECRSGRICVSFGEEKTRCDANNPCFCADGPNLKVDQQRTCFDQLLAYQVNVGRGFLVAGSQTGVQPTRQVDMNGLCQDIPMLDPRIAMRIPMNTPRCTNVPDNALYSRCNPDLPGSCVFTPDQQAQINAKPMSERAAEAQTIVNAMTSGLLDIAKKTTGEPNPCLFVGGANEADPAQQFPEHVHALFRNSEIQFLLTNLEQSPSGLFQIRFEVHGGFRPHIVSVPPTVEIGMPARLVVGPSDATAPPAGSTDDVPYLFLVDQRRLGRTGSGGSARGQLLRIHPRGLALTAPVTGSQPVVEDFTKSGELFPIQ